MRPSARHLAAALMSLLLATPIALAQSDDYDPEKRLEELGIELPTPPQPVANYVNGVRTGNLIFLAGKGPKRADGTEITGKLGADVTIDWGEPDWIPIAGRVAPAG